MNRLFLLILLILFNIFALLLLFTNYIKILPLDDDDDDEEEDEDKYFFCFLVLDLDLAIILEIKFLYYYLLAILGVRIKIIKSYLIISIDFMEKESEKLKHEPFKVLRNWRQKSIKQKNKTIYH